MKRTISVVLCLFMVLGSFSAFSGCGKKEDANTFTFWIPAGVSSEYYSDYSQNPVVDYVQKKFGLKFNFIVPIAGKEIDNFNTLIGTGDFPDVMDLSYYNSVGSVATLYDDGIAMDLTEYVENHMPNYTQYLEDNPDVGITARNQGKYLQLYGFHDQIPEGWGGFVYRRDWVAKYGTYPIDANGKSIGDAFTQNYNRDDMSYYSDDVIFPSGNTDPTTIADWEWMLEIFKSVPDCVYPMSLPYRGYYETGDLLSAFGTGSYWYLDSASGQIKFGANSSNMRTYIEKMNQWYNAGYIDPAFDTRAQDLFYEIDINRVYQGKVGMWYGLSSQFLNRMENAQQEATTDIMVYAANTPTTAEGNAPEVFFQTSRIATNQIITTKAKNKNIEKLIEALDWMYTEEAMIMKTFGLNQEQFEFTNNAFMRNRGFTEGTYTIDNQNRLFIDDRIRLDSGRLREALTASRLIGLENLPMESTNNSPAEENSYRMWTRYQALGNLSIALTGQTTDAQSKIISQAQNSVRDYMETEIARLVKNGVNDSSWNAYTRKIAGYNVNAATAIYQEIYNSFYV